MGKLIKLSPSKLETWRKYMHEEYAGTITKEKVIASITGDQEWTPKATFGSAAHAVMQFGAEKYHDESGKYIIQDGQMPTPVVINTYKELYLFDNFHNTHPNMVWESSATLMLNVDGIDCQLNMRIDGMEGTTVHENKTGENDLDYDLYDQSYQWRIYLLKTKADKCQYNHFSYYEPNTRRTEYEVFYDYMTVYPYPGMEEDVKHGIRGVINFCKTYDLMHRILYEV